MVGAGGSSPAACDKSSADPAPNRRGGRRRSSPKCRVLGCTEDLSGLKEYHIRYKICIAHHAADVVTQNGVEQRFCQQCAQFHDLAAFDGMKHSCRERLERHNKRRRKQLEDSAPENNPSDILKMLDLRSRSGILNDALEGRLPSCSEEGSILTNTSNDGRRLFKNATFSFSDIRSFSAKRFASYSLPVPNSLPSSSSVATPEELPELSQNGNGIVITTGSAPGSFTSSGSPSRPNSGQGVCMATLQRHLLAELHDEKITTSDSGYTGITTTTGIPDFKRCDDVVDPPTPMSRADTHVFKCEDVDHTVLKYEDVDAPHNAPEAISLF